MSWVWSDVCGTTNKIEEWMWRRQKLEFKSYQTNWLNLSQSDFDSNYTNY